MSSPNLEAVSEQQQQQQQQEQQLQEQLLQEQQQQHQPSPSSSPAPPPPQQPQPQQPQPEATADVVLLRVAARTPQQVASVRPVKVEGSIFAPGGSFSRMTLENGVAEELGPVAQRMIVTGSRAELFEKLKEYSLEEATNQLAAIFVAVGEFVDRSGDSVKGLLAELQKQNPELHRRFKNSSLLQDIYKQAVKRSGGQSAAARQAASRKAVREQWGEEVEEVLGLNQKTGRGFCDALRRLARVAKYPQANNTVVARIMKRVFNENSTRHTATTVDIEAAGTMAEDSIVTPDSAFGKEPNHNLLAQKGYYMGNFEIVPFGSPRPTLYVPRQEVVEIDSPSRTRQSKTPGPAGQSSPRVLRSASTGTAAADTAAPAGANSPVSPSPVAHRANTVAAAASSSSSAAVAGLSNKRRRGEDSSAVRPQKAPRRTESGPGEELHSEPNSANEDSQEEDAGYMPGNSPPPADDENMSVHPADEAMVEQEEHGAFLRFRELYLEALNQAPPMLKQLARGALGSEQAEADVLRLLEGDAKALGEHWGQMTSLAIQQATISLREERGVEQAIAPTSTVTSSSAAPVAQMRGSAKRTFRSLRRDRHS